MFILDFDMNFILLALIGMEICTITTGDSMNREQIEIVGHKSTRTRGRRLCWHPEQQSSRGTGYVQAASQDTDLKNRRETQNKMQPILCILFLLPKSFLSENLINILGLFLLFF